MAENVQWTTDLGNAFLAQQSDVMDAVQRMRGKAQGTGNLKTSSQQTVQTKAVEGGKQVIEIQQASPDVAYVPSYDPTVVYGAAPAEAPYYNYSYPGYVPGSALAWGAGVAVGAAAWGAWGGNWGNWGNCDWNHGDVNINNKNNFNKNYNKNVNRGAGQSNQWQHNPQHRGGTPYANKSTANKYGGGTRPGAGGAGTASRTAGAGAGAKAGAGTATRPGGGAAGAKPGGGAKAGGGKAAAKPSGGGGNKVGNHAASAPSKGGSAFGGGSSGGAARASSSRGASSMGGPKGGGGGARAGGGGGGGARGGGGRGGGGRGGGGGRRR